MINVLLFSPTGNTREVALTVAKELDEKVNLVDLTKTYLPEEIFNTQDLMIVAGPVFGGRMPTLMLERLKKFSLNGVRVVTLVTYGNRAYEDALLELNDTVLALGGEPFASAAIVARHSMVPSVAANRPSKVDWNNLKAFARMVQQKLSQGEFQPLNVPGERPYRSWQKAPLTPVIDGDCIHCGQCVRLCPNGAIDEKNPEKIDPTKCILCMRCVFVCSQKARALPEPIKVMINKKLIPVASLYRENEYFI